MWALIAAGHREKRGPALCNGRRWRKDDYRCGSRASEPCLSQPRPYNTYLTLYRWPLIIIIIKKHTYPASLFSFQPFCSSLRLTVINSHADGLFQAAYKCRKWHVINELFKWDVPLCSPSSLTCWWRCEETVRGDSQAPSHHLPCSTSAPWNESFPLLRRSWTPGSLQRACLFVQQCNQGVCRYKT